jgi:hypothetical protein
MIVVMLSITFDRSSTRLAQSSLHDCDGPGEESRSLQLSEASAPEVAERVAVIERELAALQRELARWQARSRALQVEGSM